jgi:hypothetical protein
MMMRAILLLATVLLATSSQQVAVAQRSNIPPPVIDGVRACIEDAMQDALSADVSTPEIEGGWQIVVPLKADPTFNRDV